jgi:hypothetical protein
LLQVAIDQQLTCHDGSIRLCSLQALLPYPLPASKRSQQQHQH